MKTIKQFLAEAEHLKSEKGSWGNWGSSMFPHLGKKESAMKRLTGRDFVVTHHKLPGGHTLIIHKEPGSIDGNLHHYGVADHTGKIHLALRTYQSGASEHVDSLASTKHNKFPAHELYHHLITKHNKMLTSDSQSTGGMAVWQKLAKKRSVNIHGWDTKTHKPVNIDKHLKDTHDSHASREDTFIHPHGSQAHKDAVRRNEEKQDILRIRLVAHKK